MDYFSERKVIPIPLKSRLTISNLNFDQRITSPHESTVFPVLYPPKSCLETPNHYPLPFPPSFLLENPPPPLQILDILFCTQN